MNVSHSNAPEAIVPEEAQAISGLLGTLGHPIRLMMVCELLGGELCAGDLTARFGTTKGNISQHLTLLLEQGILRREQRSKRNYYSISDPRVAAVIRVLKENYCPEIHRSGSKPAKRARPRTKSGKD
jgi:DNA-binding transcriptional ArsR family regulator